jgi:hypothetical protein
LGTPERPSIVTNWKTVGAQMMLVGSVKATGLKAQQTLVITVNQAQSMAGPHNGRWVTLSGPVYRSRTGGDLDGNAIVQFEVPLAEPFNAIQVVASTGDRFVCPEERASATTLEPSPEEPDTDLPACLTAAAPARPTGGQMPVGTP